MKWRVRTATPADATAVAMVASASFMAAFYDDLSIADMIAHCAANSSEAKFAAWLADGRTVVTLVEHEVTRVPLGYTVLTEPDLPVAQGPADIELRRIYLMPAAIGTGIAAALIDQAIGDARDSGAARILLGVYRANHRARRFYEKQGFAHIGERRFLVGRSWHDDAIYARDI